MQNLTKTEDFWARHKKFDLPNIKINQVLVDGGFFTYFCLILLFTAVLCSIEPTCNSSRVSKFSHKMDLMKVLIFFW